MSRLRIITLACGALLAVAVGGCAQRTGTPTGLATIEQPTRTATVDYWVTQPGVAQAQSADFDRLWQASVDTCREFDYPIDRTDYRLGVLTTKPRVSPQFFEQWRRELCSMHDQVQSSLQTVRRSFRFEFTRNAGGRYVVVPKVVIEQLALEQRRITAVSEYRAAFLPPTDNTPNQTNGVAAPPIKYWYAIGRDELLEKRLAEDIRDRVAHASAIADSK